MMISSITPQLSKPICYTGNHAPKFSGDISKPHDVALFMVAYGVMKHPFLSLGLLASALMLAGALISNALTGDKKDAPPPAPAAVTAPATPAAAK